MIELARRDDFDEAGEWTVKMSGHASFPRFDGRTEEAFERTSWQFEVHRFTERLER